MEKIIVAKKIMVLMGSPKRNGNTATLVKWFVEGARAKGTGESGEIVKLEGMREKAIKFGEEIGG